MPSLRGWLALSGGILVLDQLTKLAVTAHFQLGERLVVAPFFNLALAYNSGAAFSLLADASGWQRFLFSAIAVGAATVIVTLLRRHPGQTLFCTALALILGGALGNLIDRIWLGHVVDFLEFHYAARYYWPAFNVADSAITVGAVLLVWDSFRKPAVKQTT